MPNTIQIWVKGGALSVEYNGSPAPDLPLKLSELNETLVRVFDTWMRITDAPHTAGDRVAFGMILHGIIEGANNKFGALVAHARAESGATPVRIQIGFDRLDG